MQAPVPTACLTPLLKTSSYHDAARPSLPQAGAGLSLVAGPQAGREHLPGGAGCNLPSVLLHGFSGFLLERWGQRQLLAAALARH